MALSQARLNYIGAQYDYARYKANLEYVIGIPKGETIDGKIKLKKWTKIILVLFLIIFGITGYRY